MKVRFFMMAAATVILVGCNGNKRTEQQMEDTQSKSLVLYYSQTGATQKVASELQQMLNADVDSIVPVESYGTDYDSTIQRWRKEKEDGVKVAIKPLNVNVNEYDTIYLGFPIWGGTFASPMATFLADNSLDGKTVITFSTFGSGGIENATNDVAALQPKANVIEGYGVRNARVAKSAAEIERFLKERGYVKGDVAPMPEYGETNPVTEEEKKIFDEACGNYQFPLGTPVTVAKRSIDGTTDYRYNVVSKSPDGQETHSIIYVTVSPNEKPEFTRVVR